MEASLTVYQKLLVEEKSIFLFPVLHYRIFSLNATNGLDKASFMHFQAVDIKGLGRFTIQEFSMPVSSIYAIWSHRPVFYLDKRLCESYHIKCIRLYSSDKVSSVIIQCIIRRIKLSLY